MTRFALPLNPVFFPLPSKRQRGKCGDEVSRSFSAPGGLQSVLGDAETPPPGKHTSSPNTPDVSYPQITPDQFSPQWIINAAVLETQIKPFRPGLFQSFDLPKEPSSGVDVLSSPLPPASVRPAASSPAGEVCVWNVWNRFGMQCNVCCLHGWFLV